MPQDDHVENTVGSNSEMCANRIRAKLYVCNERSNTVTCTVGEVDLPADFTASSNRRANTQQGNCNSTRCAGSGCKHVKSDIKAEIRHNIHTQRHTVPIFDTHVDTSKR